MQKLGDILTLFNPLEDKYISREFQAYGVYLSEQLSDFKHKSLYIKLAKTVPRPLLERALMFCADAKTSRKGALFMWKLKELGAWKKNEPADAQTSPRLRPVKKAKAGKEKPHSTPVDAKAMAGKKDSRGAEVKDIPF